MCLPTVASESSSSGAAPTGTATRCAGFEADEAAADFEEIRPRLFGIAHQVLGHATEAEDVVQDAFLRYHEADAEAESPKAYLATVTTRLAIDRLRSARASGPVRGEMEREEKVSRRLR